MRGAILFEMHPMALDAKSAFFTVRPGAHCNLRLTSGSYDRDWRGRGGCGKEGELVLKRYWITRLWLWMLDGGELVECRIY